MKRYCLALDLIDDEGLIADYEKYHQEVWPEVKKSIIDSGIVEMEIYRIENRLFMIIEVNEEFDFAKKLQPMPQIPKCKNGNNSCGGINRHCPEAGRDKNGW